MASRYKEKPLGLLGEASSLKRKKKRGPPSVPHLLVFIPCVVPFYVYQGWAEWLTAHSGSDGVSHERLGHKDIAASVLVALLLLDPLWRKRCHIANSPRGPHAKGLKPPANNHMNKLGSSFSSPSEAFR